MVTKHSLSCLTLFHKKLNKKFLKKIKNKTKIKTKKKNSISTHF